MYSIIDFSSKLYTATYETNLAMNNGQRREEAKEFSCIHESDVQINCNGTVFRVRGNTTIQSGKMNGTYDGNNSIVWTNGVEWLKKGNI